MKNIYRIIYYFSIFLIVLWFIRPLGFEILGLEFTDNALEDKMKLCWIFILPASICTTLIVLALRENLHYEKWLHVFMRLIFAFVFFIISLFIYVFGSCGVDETELFKNKESNSRIIERLSDCTPYPKKS